MLQRVDAMQSELTTMTEGIRTGGNRLQADLSLLEGSMRELYDAGGRGRTEAAAAEARTREVPEPDPARRGTRPRGAGEDDRARAGALERRAPAAVRRARARAEPAPEPSTDEPDDDAEGARLIALNMALNGTSRDETDRYLAEHFDLSDRESLLTRSTPPSRAERPRKFPQRPRFADPNVCSDMLD